MLKLQAPPPWPSSWHLFAAVLLMLTGYALAGCDSSGPRSASATTGVVLNSNGFPVEAASLDFGEGRLCETDAIGRFSCPPVKPGVHTVRVSAVGYDARPVTVTIRRDGDIGPFQGLAGTQQISFPVTSQARASLRGVEFACRRRLFPLTRYGGVEFRALVDDNEVLQASNGFGGPGLCESAESGGFRHWFEYVWPTIGGVSARAATRTGTYAAVLLWGQSPANLDAHLTGPLLTGERFHVYHGRMSVEPHRLTQNVSAGFGPETIFFVPEVPGTYRFSVHNQTMQSVPGLAVTGMVSSPARVLLFGSAGLSQEFTPPAPTAQNGGSTGTTWRVFEMTRASSGVLSTSGSALSPAYVQVQNSSDGTRF